MVKDVSYKKMKDGWAGLVFAKIRLILGNYTHSRKRGLVVERIRLRGKYRHMHVLSEEAKIPPSLSFFCPIMLEKHTNSITMETGDLFLHI